MPYRHTVSGTVYRFEDLRALLAKATPLRSGDVLAGVAAASAQERVAAQMALADLPLRVFLNDTVIAYEIDEVTRLIVDTHDAAAFEPVAHLTVGGFRDWLLSDDATAERLSALAPGLTPEIAAAVSKIMRLQDLIAVGAKCRVVTRFRTTIGLEGRLSTRIQPNHPTDDPRGVLAATLDGLRLGGGDAVIGINPATDNVDACIALLEMLDTLRVRLDAPIQSCVLAHVTTTMEAMRRGAPVDLVFQSIAGTEAANRGFGIDLTMLAEAWEMALALGRGTAGANVMYFETGQGSALSANAHHGVDQQTLEARAYAAARHFKPLLVNTVVGFIGPEYLYNGKQITRAGLEDHFCGKLLGVPMGCDICYTNHAEADQDDMDALLTLLAAAGCSFIMGVPGADDIMLNYQSTSFHDALYARRLLNKRPAPEFEEWLARMGLTGPRPAGLLETIGMELAQVSVDVSSQAIWDRLRTVTPARIGIEATGVSQPTAASLDFQKDHAMARDAVYAGLSVETLAMTIREMGLEPVVLASRAKNREEYLQRPDLGRRLSSESRALLRDHSGPYDVVFVLADGLSAIAVDRHAPQLLRALLPALSDRTIGPVVIVEQGRVAVGDEVAVALEADLAVVLIGERPGLTSPDSLGAYLTWKPVASDCSIVISGGMVGDCLGPGEATLDSQRNCISNIRPDGLPYTEAAHKLSYLIREATRLQLSGVDLKEDAAVPALPSQASITAISS
jgi:ethanolamine ammonia-lyase large subunit